MDKLKVGDMVRLKRPEDAPEEWAKYTPSHIPRYYIDRLCEWLDFPYLVVVNTDGNDRWNLLIGQPEFFEAVKPLEDGFNGGYGIYIPEDMLIKVTEEELRREIEEEAK